MNYVYFQRLWQEGRLACVIITASLFGIDLMFALLDSHPRLFTIQPMSATPSSLSEIAFGLIAVISSLFVVVLCARGIAAELGRGSLRYLAAQIPSRRTLVFTLWATRALQIGAVLLISMLPFLLRLPCKLVLGAFLWTFTSSYLSFGFIELFGVLMGNVWIAILLVFPGMWAVEVGFSILGRLCRWATLDPINYVLTRYLFNPVLLGASADIKRAAVVTVAWLASFFILGFLCAELLEHKEIRTPY